MHTTGGELLLLHFLVSLLGGILLICASMPGKAQQLKPPPWSAKSGQPVLVRTWAELPTAMKDRWVGKPCAKAEPDTERSLEFHRVPGGPLIALMPCRSFVPHGEVWQVGSATERLSLPEPSFGPDGGFTTTKPPSLGALNWDIASNRLTSTTSSDMIPDLVWRKTYVWAKGGGMTLIKVESALNRPYPYEWQIEWEAKPWRARAKGPAANP